MKGTAHPYPQGLSYRGGVRLAELLRRLIWRDLTDSPADDGRAMWEAWIQALDGDQEAALGELVAVLLEGDLL